MSKFTITKKIAVLVALLFLFVGIAGYFLMIHHEKKTIENQALSISEIVARQAGAARDAYANTVIGKVTKDGVAYPHPDYHDKKGAVPIPSQFVKEMAVEALASSGGLYRYRGVSEWNLGEDQGLNNDFLQSAWLELKAQDKANPQKEIDWKPIHRIQEVEGQETFLFLEASPATHESCVGCHNTYEQNADIMQRRSEQQSDIGRSWKKHQLMGAIFVEIPLESMIGVASKQSRFTILWIFGALMLGIGALAFFFSRDLIKAQKIKDRLFWQAKHDALTRLPNRNSFEFELEQLVTDALTKHNQHALCFLDLDHFKLVNDTCGHAVGDKLLRELSAALSSRLDENGFIARLGGDEFGLLLRHCDLEEASLIANKLCEMVKAYQFVKGSHVFDIGVSIGIVAIDQYSGNPEKLIKCADLACYAAKESGKNRIHVYQNDDIKLNRKEAEISWATEMNRALDENRIIIYSQRIGPVSSSAEDEHVHHEILVRLIDQKGNVILPDNFIPAAERYNMMSKLDLAILDRSFSALSSGYFKDLGKTGFISINLSGQSFGEGEFLSKVKGLMVHYSVNPKQICFEITETAAIENQVLVKEFMLEMKCLGVKFSLDDFGTGLSSLTYLKQFPVDYLKIDGSFIKDILTDEIDRTLVDAINKMAHTMGLKTIAEYVESKEILNFLDKINVDYAQGYYLQKPTIVDVK